MPNNIHFGGGGSGSGTPIKLTSIAITTAPTKTSYYVGDTFDATGMVVEATYSSGISNEITGYTISPSGALTAGTTAVTITYSEGGITKTATQKITVSKQPVTIYGVQWDGTSTTTLSRTDAAASFTNPSPAIGTGSGSSPFDNLMPWSGMVKTTDSTAGTLVAIPKYYYKWTVSGSTVKLQIADGPVDGFYVSPAHADRGDGAGERDMVYVGRYHCISGYKSATGAQQVSITRSTARSNISALGSAYWQWDWAMNWTIKMLYLVEFADWDSQTKIGYGCSDSESRVNNGQTDSMTYHTGTTASSRTTYGYTQYRWIEGLWDNVHDWVDGCYYNSSGLNVIMNPNNFSDSANGTAVGTLTSGSPSALTVKTALSHQWLLPSASSGSTTTYVPDSWSFNSSNPCLFVGGFYLQDLGPGLFYVSYSKASDASARVGCRLMKLP